MSYSDLLVAVTAGQVVIVTLGVDSDGDHVCCTSTFDSGSLDDQGADWLRDPDPVTRANCLVGAVRAVAEDLEERHGIRCP